MASSNNVDVLGNPAWYDFASETMLAEFRKLREQAHRTNSSEDAAAMRNLAEVIANRSEALNSIMFRELRQFERQMRQAGHAATANVVAMPMFQCVCIRREPHFPNNGPAMFYARIIGEHDSLILGEKPVPESEFDLRDAVLLYLNKHLPTSYDVVNVEYSFSSRAVANIWLRRKQ